MFTFNEYWKVRRKYFGETIIQAKKNYVKYKKAKEVKPTEAIQFLADFKTPFPLAHCGKAEPAGFNMPCTATSVRCKIEAYDCCNKEGTNPMYNECKKTEVDVSRQYLTGRLSDVNYTKRDQLRKLFNLDAVAIPKSYKELIDAIKNDKYTMDAKVVQRIEVCVEDEGCYYGSPFDGIIFTGFPKPDYEGHATAVSAQAKEYIKVKDAIYVLSAADALAALVAFEAWVPTTA